MSEPYPYPADKYILIGKIIRAHGLKGELKVLALSDQPENFYEYSRFALVAKDGRMTSLLNLINVRIQGKHVIIKLDTIDTKNEADLTAGMGLLLPSEDLPELTEDSYYFRELLGRPVRVLDTEQIVGTIDSIFSNGAHDIMVVRKGEQEFLIPLIEEIIVSRSPEEIVIAPPPGLLEINSKKQ